MIQPEYRNLVDEALGAAREWLGRRFLAAYLHGSVEKGDAVPGVSDLDLAIVVSQSDREADGAWLRELCASLEQRYPVIDEAHITLTALNELKENRFARFAYMVNASLIAGEDVAAALNDADAQRYLPDKRMAKMRLGFAKQCFEDALAGKTPACTGALPENACDAARKLARYFVVIEGAYFLMARGRFQSFDADGVVRLLSEEAGMFTEEIELARRVLVNSSAAGIDPKTLLSRIEPLVRWMFEEIEKA